MRPFRSWMFIRPSIQGVALLYSDSPLIPSFHNDNLKAGSDMLRTIALARVNKTLLNQALFEGRSSHWLKQTEPVKIGLPKRKLIFQPPILRCYVSFREVIFKTSVLWILWILNMQHFPFVNCYEYLNWIKFGQARVNTNFCIGRCSELFHFQQSHWKVGSFQGVPVAGWTHLEDVSETALVIINPIGCGALGVFTCCQRWLYC